MLGVSIARRTILWAAILVLTGCATPDVLSNRAIDFNETTARAADSQLLLNIVRAAYRNPTHYTAISQLRDVRLTEGTFQATAQIPIGPDAARLFTLIPNTGLKASATPSFDVVPLDNRASAQGLFRPVDSQVFYLYWAQGWPPPVLLPLFIDRIKVTQEVKRECNLHDLKGQYIDNSAHSYEVFNRAQRFFACIQGSIMLDEVTKDVTFIDKAAIPPAEILKKLSELQKDDFTVKEHKTSKGTKYTIKKTKKTWVMKWPIGPRKTQYIASTEAKPDINFTLRSVDGMVYYLGELLRLQLHDNPPTLVKLGPAHSVLFKPHIDSGRELGERIEVEFLGKRFAIPRQGDEAEKNLDRTLTSFALVSQLFSLYREGADLPKTTAVQVVGQ